MGLRPFLRGILVFVLCLAFATTAEPQSGSHKIVSNGEIGGIIAGVVAGVVVVVIVAYHVSKKKTVTGCVVSTGSELRITDEADKKNYSLTGNTGDLKPGERMALRGRKVKTKKDGTKTVAWEVRKMTHDFGTCKP